MSPLIRYDARDASVVIAANFTSILVPLISDPDLAEATVAELEAGTAFECSIREIGVTGAATNNTDQFLCDEEPSETPGPVTWSIDPVVILMGDPQAPNPLLDSLTRGSVHYLVQRRGLPHADPFAAAQRISITKVEVSLVEDVAVAANTEGRKFESRVHFAVRKHERNAVVAAA